MQPIIAMVVIEVVRNKISSRKYMSEIPYIKPPTHIADGSYLYIANPWILKQS
jgi:hypothetical protein